MSARAITAGELVKLRKTGNFSQYYLAIDKGASVYTARVNQTFSTTDKIAEVTFDTGSGTLTALRAGMTLFVGSSAGAYDRGIARLRVTPTTGDTSFKIGETSEIDWADNAYLTVVDEYRPWIKYPLTTYDTGGNITTVKMDYATAYTDEWSNIPPIVRAGPTMVPVFRTGATVAVPFDFSNSATIGGGTRTYASSCATASASSGTTTATPTFTFNSDGRHIVNVNVTANGKTSIGRRFVYVYSASSMPITQFEVSSDPMGTTGAGGWEFAVTLYDQAAIADVRPGAMVTLFARDVFGGVVESLGPIANRNNIICFGWIDGESIQYSGTGRGSVTFNVRGPMGWANSVTGAPIKFTNKKDNESASWVKIPSMTVDKVAFTLLYYMSTLSTLCDITLTGDTQAFGEIDLSDGTLYSQLSQVTETTVFAKPLANRFGQVYAETDLPMQPTGSRTPPTVMTVTAQDVSNGGYSVEYTPPGTGRVEMVSYDWSSGTKRPWYSLSTGHVPGALGTNTTYDGGLAASQSDANTLAGLYYGRENAAYTASFELVQNNRFIDIAPRQRLALSIPAANSPRNLAISGNFIPRQVSLICGPGLTAQIDAVIETDNANAVNGDIPTNGGGVITIPIIDPGGGDPPIIIKPPRPGELPGIVYMLTEKHGLWYTLNFNEPSPSWLPVANSGIGSFTTPELNPHSIYISPAGGIYVATFSGVGYIPSPGSAMATLIDRAWLDTYYPVTNGQSGYVFCLGGDDTGRVGFIAGRPYAPSVSAESHLWIGNNSGFSKKTAVQYSWGDDPIDMDSTLSNAEARWLYTYSATLSQTYAQRFFDNAGAAVIGGSDIGTGYPLYHARGGQNAYIFGQDAFWVWSGNGATMVDTGKQMVLTNSFTKQAVACDATGQYVMGTYRTGANTHTPFYSTDNCATFGTLTLPGAALKPCFANAFGASTWIFADQNAIYGTVNAGTAWSNKTGDLLTWLPSGFKPRFVASLFGGE